MKFLSVMPNLYVADVEASAAFYRDRLGGTETFRLPAAGPATHVELRIGDVTLAVSSRDVVTGQGLPAPSGGHPFELVAWCDSADEAVAALRAAGVTRVEVALTPLSEAGERIAADTAAALASADAEIVTDRDRAGGRGYYRDVCFKVNALADGAVAEIGDGGFTDWTARLLANGKERLLITGYGTDRLAAAAGLG